jgi:hypothetical protein
MTLTTTQQQTAEYRIPERDTTDAPRCALKRNACIRFRRIVSRVGYPVGKHSFTSEEWDQKAAEIVAGKSGLAVADVKKVVAALENKSAFRYLHHEVYAALVAPARAKAKNANIRSMWFQDVAETVCVLNGYRMRQTGVYVPPVKISYEFDEWDAPSLESVCYQRLLVVITSSRMVLVHPLDAEEVGK